MAESLRKTVREALIAAAHNPDFIAEVGTWYVDPSESLGLENISEFYDLVRNIASITVEE